jgi:hypothetical protein
MMFAILKRCHTADPFRNNVLLCNSYILRDNLLVPGHAACFGTNRFFVTAPLTTATDILKVTNGPADRPPCAFPTVEFRQLTSPQ